MRPITYQPSPPFPVVTYFDPWPSPDFSPRLRDNLGGAWGRGYSNTQTQIYINATVQYYLKSIHLERLLTFAIANQKRARIVKRTIDTALLS